MEGARGGRGRSEEVKWVNKGENGEQGGGGIGTGGGGRKKRGKEMEDE